MSILRKLFHRDTPRHVTLACPHRVLVLHWEHTRDVRTDNRAAAFCCEACGAVFAGDDGQRLLNQPATVGCTQ
jgi:hypothetical protein